ncbi:hypothetical protein VULLAG_LOCUS13768 [Vulpes lagopus]
MGTTGQLTQFAGCWRRTQVSTLKENLGQYSEGAARTVLWRCTQVSTLEVHPGQYSGGAPRSVLWRSTQVTTLKEHPVSTLKKNSGQYSGGAPKSVLWRSTQVSTLKEHPGQYSGGAPRSVLWRSTQVSTLEENPGQYSGGEPRSVLAHSTAGKLELCSKTPTGSFLLGHIRNITKPAPTQTELRFSTEARASQPGAKSKQELPWVTKVLEGVGIAPPGVIRGIRAAAVSRCGPGLAREGGRREPSTATGRGWSRSRFACQKHKVVQLGCVHLKAVGPPQPGPQCPHSGADCTCGETAARGLPGSASKGSSADPYIRRPPNPKGRNMGQ